MTLSLPEVSSARNAPLRAPAIVARISEKISEKPCGTAGIGGSNWMKTESKLIR
jgi:hypothetical protein